MDERVRVLFELSANESADKRAKKGTKRKNPLRLEQIADELGYSDVANFSRAFKRWSGRSPSSWRKDPYL